MERLVGVLLAWSRSHVRRCFESGHPHQPTASSVAGESLWCVNQQSIAGRRTLGSKSFHNYQRGSDRLGVAFTTAQRAIERLERTGIVKRVGDAKRDRVYCAGALLD